MRCKKCEKYFESFHFITTSPNCASCRRAYGRERRAQKRKADEGLNKAWAKTLFFAPQPLNKKQSENAANNDGTTHPWSAPRRRKARTG